MALRERVRILLRMILLSSVLAAAALGSAIMTIRLSIRGRQQTMPQLVGAPVEAAQGVAADLGMVLKVEDKVFSDRFASGQIVSQQPNPGTRIKTGQHVHVLVSLGPPRAQIPNLVGMSLRAARITAIQRGLIVSGIATLPWPGSENDQVVAQDPLPTESVVHTPAVNLLVSLGEPSPSYLCPDFVGQPVAAARRQLEKEGLKIKGVTPLPAAGAPKGSILFQSPTPGSKIGSDADFTFQVAE